ncbi:actin depolymerizing protein [Pelomyxa schiedti]|nr:actin depolymerizing protein [Pelomyxa schiedti]
MSSATAIPISRGLGDLWEVQKPSTGTVRVIKIRIKDETCDVDSKREKTNSVENDFNALRELVSETEACYILFRKSDSQWFFISFVPDRAPIADKLVYAATTSPLKHNLGGSFIDDFRFDKIAEFNWTSYLESKKPVKCLSEREKQIEKLNEMEAQARREQEEAASRKLRSSSTSTTSPSGTASDKTRSLSPVDRKPSVGSSSTTPASPKTTKAPSAIAKPAPPLSSVSTSTSSGVSGLAAKFEYMNTGELSTSPSASRPVQEEHVRVDGIGGYHTVKLPLSSSATTALSQYKTNTINFIELQVTEDPEEIVAAYTGSIPVGSVGSRIITTEPRFYLYNFMSPSALAPKSLFIYCCPDKSPAKMRMVYSTVKPTVSKEISVAGINLAKNFEIRGPEEFTVQQINDALRPSHASYEPAKSTTTNKSRTVEAPHPVYSMIGGEAHSGSTKKKITLPPSGAYE